MAILRTLFCLKVKGLEHIPKKGGFILASNHLSFLDPAAVGVACPRKLNYMARHDLFFNPFFSWWLHNVGVFPVKRDYADKSALKEAISRVKDGNGLVLFPEGARRTGNDAFSRPQPGIGFLVTKLDVPVIPVLVSGTEKALPRDAKFIRLAKISVSFGKQISIERRMPYQDIAQRIMENIRHLECLASN